MKKEKLFLIKSLALIASSCVLVACGGSSDSGGGSLAQDREALECVEFSDGNVINLCNFDIVVRTFGGSSTPVTVPANGTEIDPDANIFFGTFGACEAPFTPVETDDSASGFECL